MEAELNIIKSKLPVSKLNFSTPKGGQGIHFTSTTTTTTFGGFF